MKTEALKLQHNRPKIYSRDSGILQQCLYVAVSSCTPTESTISSKKRPRKKKSLVQNPLLLAPLISFALAEAFPCSLPCCNRSGWAPCCTKEMSRPPPSFPQHV